MSANDKLIIVKEGKKYIIYHDYCMDNPFQFSKHNIIVTETSLKDAIIFANRYCEKNQVEYGYEFVGVETIWKEKEYYY